MLKPAHVPTEAETLLQARPYLRGAIALLLYVTRAYLADPELPATGPLLPKLYGRADEFLNRLAGDVKEGEAK